MDGTEPLLLLTFCVSRGSSREQEHQNSTERHGAQNCDPNLSEQKRKQQSWDEVLEAIYSILCRTFVNFCWEPEITYPLQVLFLCKFLCSHRSASAPKCLNQLFNSTHLVFEWSDVNFDIAISSWLEIDDCGVGGPEGVDEIHVVGSHRVGPEGGKSQVHFLKAFSRQCKLPMLEAANKHEKRNMRPRFGWSGNAKACRI